MIGIGINISLDSEIKASIDQPVADLCDVLDSKISRNRLAGKLVGSLIRALETFEKTGFKCFRDKFLAKDLLYGKKLLLILKMKNRLVTRLVLIGMGHYYLMLMEE